MSDKTIPRHAFTSQIEAILSKHFGDAADDVLRASPLLGYLNYKTKSANRGSKSRGSFANHYALYVVIEDYINKGYLPGGPLSGRYSDYEGARFSDLFRRQRELPFGQKLQNHALNTRLNDEFKKFFPSVDKEPIVRDVAKQRYWIHEDLINVDVRGNDGKKHRHNLAKAIIDLIDAYVATKKEAFEGFLETCRQISELAEKDVKAAFEFIKQQIQPNVDARLFEIVSFSILKSFYGEKTLFWGWTRDALNEEVLTLYKTGRTNANDGGIDFVMKPLGRFFQVTETIDVNKYFLDIDKIQRFPLTFVVKSMDDTDTILNNIEQQAVEKYKIKAVVKSYLDAVEEIINIPVLLERLELVLQAGKIPTIMEEIITQSRVEFNYAAQDDLEAEEEEDLLTALGDEPIEPLS
jgi:hypothetical protein